MSIWDREAIDLMGIRKEGKGVDLFLIVKEPLDSDENVQTALLGKLETYFSFINSDEYSAKHGPPSPATTRIMVEFHARPHPVIEELLEAARPWAEDNHASIVCVARYASSEGQGET